MIFQLHPIITSLILDQLACSLPKTLLFTSFSNMSRRMQIFHQLDEKITETFLADFYPDRLYYTMPTELNCLIKAKRYIYIIKVQHLFSIPEIL